MVMWIIGLFIALYFIKQYFVSKRKIVRPPKKGNYKKISYYLCRNLTSNIGQVKDVCPYCGHKILSQRKQECSSCSKKIFQIIRPSDGKLVWVTLEEREILANEHEKKLFIQRHFDDDFSYYEEILVKMKKRAVTFDEAAWFRYCEIYKYEIYKKSVYGVLLTLEDMADVLFYQKKYEEALIWRLKAFAVEIIACLQEKKRKIEIRGEMDKYIRQLNLNIDDLKSYFLKVDIHDLKFGYSLKHLSRYFIKACDKLVQEKKAEAKALDRYMKLCKEGKEEQAIREYNKYIERRYL